MNVLGKLEKLFVFKINYLVVCYEVINIVERNTFLAAS